MEGDGKLRCAILPSATIEGKLAAPQADNSGQGQANRCQRSLPAPGDTRPPPQIEALHHRMLDFLAPLVVPFARIASSNSMQKLGRLTVGQLSELLVDLGDEIARRRHADGSREPFLAIRLEYSPKRNQARQKLADLGEARFTELIASVVMELERRYHGLRAASKREEMETPDLDKQFDSLSKSLADVNATPPSEVAKLIEASTTSGPLSVTMLPTPCTEKIFCPQMTEPEKSADHTLGPADSAPSAPTPLVPEAVDRRTFSFDCLDSLLAELNVMIGKEQSSELEEIKTRHQKELLALKEYISHLEEEVIPGKNREIASLAAHLGESEVKLSVVKQEREILAQKLSQTEVAFQEQAVLLENVQSAYIQLQKQLSQGLRSPKMAVTGGSCGSASAEALASASSLSSPYQAQVFTSLWSTYFTVLEVVNRSFEKGDSPMSDRLRGVKDACAVAQRLVKDVERLLVRLGRESMPWLTADLNACGEAKSQCIHALSYCVFSCRDALSGQLKGGDREVRDALSQLTRHVRGLVDAAELVSSRAQVPPIQQSGASPATFSKSEGGLPAAGEASGVQYGLLDCESAKSLMMTFKELRNALESEGHAGFSSRAKKQIGEAMGDLTRIVQTGKLLRNADDMGTRMGRSLAQLEDAQRKLQLALPYGTQDNGDIEAHSEILNAISTIIDVLSAPSY